MNDSPVATSDERSLAMVAHLLGFAGFIVPFGNIIGPLVVWLLKREQSAYVGANAKEALNFQISMTIYHIIAGVLWCFVIGVFITVPLLIFQVVVMILAAIKAQSGEGYRYPLTFRLVS